MNNGAIVYEGMSCLDSSPIVCIATGLKASSVNVKTGSMVQTWILRSDIPLIEAVKTGADISICGDCQHRGTSCYVQVFQAPNNIYRSYKKGNYTHANDLTLLLQGRALRLGSYGDPAAVPEGTWRALIAGAGSLTGYTHQWKKARFSHLKQWCMASVDSQDEYALAKSLGWRTFRVRRPDEELLSREVICPASSEAGFKTTCAQCLACGGFSAKAKADIVIMAHGSAGKVNAFSRR